MNRKTMLASLEPADQVWDVIVVGGGATGVGCALDAASRGYKTLLLERGDFGEGTSSRSTKLIHGGVRYLQQGNIALVLEALKERGILRRNAPHLVHDLPFIVPVYDWWEGPFYGIGLKLYDALAGREGFGASRQLSKEETIARLPTIEQDGLRGGVIYYDGQFDDARLLINLVQTACDQGATLLNYFPVTGFTKANGVICGVEAEDSVSGTSWSFKAKVVVNACGVFCDGLRKMDEPACEPIMTSSQGIHIVLDRSFLPGDTAIMVPHTDDGRVLFAIPWHGSTLVGTTETPVTEFTRNPIPGEDEIDFLLKHAARYLARDPSREDIKGAFAGLRPLVKSGDAKDTAAISREHTIHISRSGLITIAGGKWTTYRKMAEDTIDQVIHIGHLDFQPCITEALQIHGYHRHTEQFGDLAIYGSDAIEIQAIIRENPLLGERIHPEIPVRKAELSWSIREEMVQQADDFLSRRIRLALLDEKAAQRIKSLIEPLEL